MICLRRGRYLPPFRRAKSFDCSVKPVDPAGPSRPTARVIACLVVAFAARPRDVFLDGGGYRLTTADAGFWARQGWPKTDPRMPSHKFHIGETVTLILS